MRPLDGRVWGVKTGLAESGRIGHLSAFGRFLTFRTVGDPAGDLDVNQHQSKGLGALTRIPGFKVDHGPCPAAPGDRWLLPLSVSLFF